MRPEAEAARRGELWHGSPVAEKRTILHVDLDAFYASVEQRDDPALRGKPVIVAGPPPRGVVAAASYEARRFGVKSAIPTAQALQRCPHAVLVHPRMSHYAEVSDGFFAILRTYSPLVEGLSLDEAFLDATGEERLFGDGVAIARTIKSLGNLGNECQCIHQMHYSCAPHDNLAELIQECLVVHHFGKSLTNPAIESMSIE